MCRPTVNPFRLAFLLVLLVYHTNFQMIAFYVIQVVYFLEQ